MRFVFVRTSYGNWRWVLVGGRRHVHPSDVVFFPTRQLAREDALATRSILGLRAQVSR